MGEERENALSKVVGISCLSSDLYFEIFQELVAQLTTDVGT